MLNTYKKKKRVLIFPLFPRTAFPATRSQTNIDTESPHTSSHVNLQDFITGHNHLFMLHKTFKSMCSRWIINQSRFKISLKYHVGLFLQLLLVTQRRLFQQPQLQFIYDLSSAQGFKLMSDKNILLWHVNFLSAFHNLQDTDSKPTIRDVIKKSTTSNFQCLVFVLCFR